MSTINEKTAIPLFAVVVALPFVVGAIFWLASVDSKATEAKEKLTGVESRLIDIRERLIRIEDKVNK